MARQLVHNNDAKRITESGTSRTIREGDLTDAAALAEGEERTVWSKQVPANKVFAHGAGSNSRNHGRTAFIHADIKAGGGGTGTAGDAVTGDLVAVVTDSEQRDVHARYEIGDLATLAAAASENRSDRPMQPVTVPIAREDQHLELRIIADSNSDGVQIDDGSTESTDVRLNYTDIAI